MADIEAVIAGYLKLRDKRKQLKSKYEEEDKKLQDQLEILENYIKKVQRELNITQLKCLSGVAFTSPRIVYNCKDWNRFIQWAIENNHVGFLQRRLSNSSIQEFVDANNIIPPGLEAVKLEELHVRKNS